MANNTRTLLSILSAVKYPPDNSRNQCTRSIRPNRVCSSFARPFRPPTLPLGCFKMRLNHLFTFLLTSFIFVKSKPLTSVSQDLSIIFSCNSSSPVDRTSLNRALIDKRFEGSVDDTFKCFLQCLYEGYGWMDGDGQFRYEEMRMTLMESNLEESSIEYLITTCTETEVENKCERAFKFTECFWSEGEKLEQRDLSAMDESC